MATLNFLYRSKKENVPLNLRLLFRNTDLPSKIFYENIKQFLEVPYTDFAIGAKIRVNFYSEEELKKEPELSAKKCWTKDHSKKRPKDIEISNKQQEVNTYLNNEF